MEGWKRTFTVIWCGQLVSVLSSAVVSFAVIFHLSLETDSAEVLAWAAIASMLPQAILGLAAGVYVDRWDRKRTMILADSFIALCTLALALLFRAGIAQMWHIYLLLACRSAGSAFHMPAMQASVPLLAPAKELTRIAGVNQAITALANIAGPALGALLLSAVPIGNILLLDVAGAMVACFSLLFVRIPNPVRSSLRPQLLREIREGFGAIAAVHGMVPLFTLSTLAYLFLMPVGVLFPLMTLRHFGGGAAEMSLIETLWGGGALIGGAVMGLRTYRTNRVTLIHSANMVVGAAFLLSGLLPREGFIWFAAFTVTEGIAGGIFNASFVSVVQSRIDPAALGRVLSLYFSLGVLPAITGLLGTGFLAEEIGLCTAFVLSGTAIFSIGAIGFALPSVMRLGRHEVP